MLSKFPRQGEKFVERFDPMETPQKKSPRQDRKAI